MAELSPLYPLQGKVKGDFVIKKGRNPRKQLFQYKLGILTIYEMTTNAQLLKTDHSKIPCRNWKHCKDNDKTELISKEETE